MKAYCQLVLAVFTFLVMPIAYAASIESGAVISDQLKGKSEALDAMAAMVKASGYRCDSISAARPMMMSRGYVLTCNRFAYSYDIEDKGGNWRVKVQ